MSRTARKVILSALLAGVLLVTALLYHPLRLSADRALGLSGGLGGSGPPLGDSRPGLGASSEALDASTYIVDGDWALVANFQALSDALKAAEPLIRLTADIDMISQLDLTYPVVIDGLKADGEGRHTLNETSGKNNFRAYAANIRVTFQNLNIIGYDYFGILTSSGADAKSAGATLILDHAHYTGPQLAYLRYDGTVIIRDSEVDLVKNGTGNDAEEVGEAAQFIIGGKTRITKHSHAASLFWIYNQGASSTKNGLLEFEPGSQVTIYNPRTYLTYREMGDNGVKEYNVIVGDGAKVDIRTNEGWCHTAAQYIDNLTVGKNASLTMSRSGTAASKYLSIYKSLTVGEGSVFIMEDVRPIIALYSYNVDIVFDNPALVRIDYSITGLDATYRPRSVTMTAKAFNTWRGSPVSGTPDDHLNGPQGQPVTIAYSGGQSTARYLDEEGKEVIVGADNLLPYGYHTTSKQTRFVMGGYDLLPNSFTAYSTEITGAMSTDATLSAAYLPRDSGSGSDRISVSAQESPQHGVDGLSGFRVDPGVPPDEQGFGPFAPEEEVHFSLVRTFGQEELQLTAASHLFVYEARGMDHPGDLLLKSVPGTLDFGGRTLPGKLTYFPLMTDAQVVVLDDRKDPPIATWNLTAVSTPLETEDASLGYAIGILEQGAFTSLERQTRLWTGARLEEMTEQSRTWEAGSSTLVVQVDPYTAQAGAYRAEILWSLTVGI